MNAKPTPYQVLDSLTDDQLDALLSVHYDELSKLLATITYSRVAKRLWANK